jgi:hypothetical protein
MPTNERVIMHNLEEFFKHGKPKTVVVVAHTPKYRKKMPIKSLYSKKEKL